MLGCVDLWVDVEVVDLTQKNAIFVLSCFDCLSLGLIRDFDGHSFIAIQSLAPPFFIWRVVVGQYVNNCEILYFAMNAWSK